MKNIKVLEVVVMSNDKVCYQLDTISEEELWDGGWSGFWTALTEGSLDPIWFPYSAIDKTAFVSSDGADYIRLNDGSYATVCWRGHTCHVWPASDKSAAKFNRELSK